MIELSPPVTDVRLNWDDANLYCFSLNIDGKTGWRLPTLDEIMDISQVVNSTLILPAAYWTSNTDSGKYCVYIAPVQTWSAWYMDRMKIYRVRAVRDI